MNRFLNKIIQGDCLEVMKDIPDGTVDMVLCDLPYGLTDCEWDTIIPLEELWRQYKRIIKDRATICLFGIEPFSSQIRISNLKMFKYDWIWVKNTIAGFANSKKQPLRNYEIISVYYDKQPIYNPQGLRKLDPAMTRTITTKKSKGTSVYGGKDNLSESLSQPHKSEHYNFPKNVLYFDSEEDKIHPTQKPVNLIKYLIQTYTNPGDIVLDNCIGSGTTAVAAIKSNRRYIGIELNQEYVDIARRRVDKELSQLDFFRADFYE